MDGVRVTFAFMGIMFHMAFWYILNPQELIAVKTIDYSKVFYWVTEVIRLFRMDSFFLIAGFFTAMGMVKLDFSVFIKVRVTKLYILNLVPILFVVTTLVSYFIQLRIGSLGPLSEGYWDSILFMHHLWFLEVLFVYYVVYGFLSKKTNVMHFLQYKVQTVHVLLLGFIYLVWAFLAKVFPLLWADNFFGDTIFRLFIYLPYFMLGATMYFNKELVDSFMKLSWVRILISTMLIIVYLYFIDKRYGVIGVYDEPDFTVKLITYLAQGFASLGSVYLIFLASSRIFKSESRLLKYLGDRSYTVYLLHFPLCLIFGYFFTRVNLDTRFEYICSVISVYIITLLMHDVIVKQTHSKVIALKSSEA